MTTMRLIDADVLTSILEKWEEQACDGTENDGSDGTTRVLHPVPTTTREMIDLIAEQFTIEAEPVKHGRWDEIPNRYMSVSSKDGSYSGHATSCSVCHEVNPNAFKTNYCPNCGAKMGGGAEQ